MNELQVSTNIDDIEALSDILSTYGTAIVAIAVFFIIFIAVMIFLIINLQKQMNRLSTQDDEYKDHLKDTNRKLIFGNGKEDVKENDVEDGHKAIIERHVQATKYMRHICSEIRTLGECQRVGVYMLHNGTNSLSGFPFIKISCVVETVTRGRGIDGMIRDHADMPVTMFPELYADLEEKGYYYVDRTEQYTDKDPIVSKMMKQNNVQTVYFKAIKDAQNTTIGFIGADYMELTPSHPKIYSIMENAAARLLPVFLFKEITLESLELTRK